MAPKRSLDAVKMKIGANASKKVKLSEVAAALATDGDVILLPNTVGSIEASHAPGDASGGPREPDEDTGVGLANTKCNGEICLFIYFLVPSDLIYVSFYIMCMGLCWLRQSNGG